MTVCVSIKDLKDTAAFAEKVESVEEPVVVTNHGREAFANMPVGSTGVCAGRRRGLRSTVRSIVG